MKFSLYFLGEYAAMITGSAVIVTLFFGGWHLPGIPDGSHGWIFGLINIAVFFAKVAIIIFFFMWVRWTLPRFRYDQLRSEEHTSELQSLTNLVCRLLLEKKKK